MADASFPSVLSERVRGRNLATVVTRRVKKQVYSASMTFLIV